MRLAKNRTKIQKTFHHPNAMLCRYMKTFCYLIWSLYVLRINSFSPGLNEAKILSYSVHEAYGRPPALSIVRSCWWFEGYRNHDSLRELQSSFFDKFDEQEDDEDDDEDEDDEDPLVDDSAVEKFRSRMANLFDDTTDQSSGSKVDELISFAVKTSDASPNWAIPVARLTAGCVLVANPDAFCSDCAAAAKQDKSSKNMSNYKIRPALLAKFGLTIPPPIDLGPDRRADLLPVLIVVEHDDVNNKRQSRAVLLNRRTGYLLGDLEQQSMSGESSTPLLEKFCIQPLWFGGVDSDASDAGLDMLHQCEAVPGSVPITDDGLYWGGDPAQAKEAMEIPVMNPVTGKRDRMCTGFDFKFFVQRTVYPAGALQKEIDQGTFFAVQVAKDVLFQSRDRMGTRRAKPLWTEILELLGGEYLTIKAKLYGEDSLESDADNESYL